VQPEAGRAIVLTETDAKIGQCPNNCSSTPNLFAERRGVPSAVGQEHAIGVQGTNLLGAGLAGTTLRRNPLRELVKPSVVLMRNPEPPWCAPDSARIDLVS